MYLDQCKYTKNGANWLEDAECRCTKMFTEYKQSSH